MMHQFITEPRTVSRISSHSILTIPFFGGIPLVAAHHVQTRKDISQRSESMHAPKGLTGGKTIMATGRRMLNPVKKTIEPVVTLSDEGTCIRVMAELPGIREEMIRIDLERSTLIISASDNGKRYKKEISLPARTRFGTKRFRNGVLDLLLEKTSTR